MNIVRALDVALPELPERLVRDKPPKLDPRIIFKEHIENGEPLVLAKVPGTELVFRFPPLQWKLIQMFDGTRSCAEIAEQFQAENAVAISVEDVQELVSFLQSNGRILYRTPTEQSITLQQELRSSRKKRSRFHGLDFSDITIKTWHNADNYISKLYPRLRFLFTPWFVWTSIGMFALMGWMWADRFGEIWSDSFAFYNFTQKSGRDLAEFWFLFGAMAAIHETAHGLAGKHFGATIEKMGFTLMYFAPSFFCDATQVWVMGGKWARIATSIAGIWLDLVICFFATVVWWGTAAGMTVHDWAYKVMMVTGLGVSILNLNPLIKLDGYLIFSELVREPSLKESSTAYLSQWSRRHIFRLPVEVPYVPRRKRPFFVIYGILSGLYSYSLLSFLMVITYHILRSFTPEWAFLPSLAIGYWVFQSRVKLMVKFMKVLYLDKKERIRAWFTPVRFTACTAALVVVLFAPIWPDFVQGQFVLTAAQRVSLHATVPGVVNTVSVQEGQRIAPGTPLLHMTNFDLESEAARAYSDLATAAAKAVDASLHYSNQASAEQERREKAEIRSLVNDKMAQLSIVSPIAGVVATPHLMNLVGKSLADGDPLIEVADTSRMLARIYVPEFSMQDIHTGTSARLLVHGRVTPKSTRIVSISPTSAEIAAGLVSKEQLHGINPPRYYLATAVLKNDESLMEGMTGSAKVWAGRRSLAGFCFRFGRELVQRKIW
jgi:putative peptide zinc metalloprotease protein